MRLFAIFCFAVAFFYGWTAVETMRTGVAHPLGGSSEVVQRRDDPESRYQRCLAARWLFASGFAALGVVMQVFAGRLEAVDSDERK